MRNIRIVSTVLLLASFAAVASAHNNDKKCLDVPKDIPAAIAVPDGHCLKEKVTGSGAQIYSCVGGVWTLKAPEANLTDKGKFVGNHFLGPTWQWVDGSKVKAARTAQSPGSTASDIPWLLLTVTKEEGEGKLDGTKFIQRIHTLGGVAPTDPCTVTNDLVVGYKADYLFWKEKKK